MVWNDSRAGESQPPAVAEFSFRYTDDDEHYPAEICRAADRLFRILPTRAAHWIDPDGVTKTAFVFNRAGGV